MSPAFERQGWHALMLAVLLGTSVALVRAPGWDAGSWGGQSTAAWFAWALAVPVLHETYVALCWRAQLHGERLTRALGRAAFPLYAALFLTLFAARAVSVVGLALSSRDTLGLNLVWRMALLGLVVAPAVWTLHSVVVHFGVLRATGRDHFDPAVRALPPVREGAFRSVPNAMYTFAFALFWVPGLYWASWPAAVAAGFAHLGIWAHWWCTEVPDLRRMHDAG